jgi:hypothetical protein
MILTVRTPSHTSTRTRRRCVTELRSSSRLTHGSVCTTCLVVLRGFNSSTTMNTVRKRHQGMRRPIRRGFGREHVDRWNLSVCAWSRLANHWIISLQFCKVVTPRIGCNFGISAAASVVLYSQDAKLRVIVCYVSFCFD